MNAENSTGNPACLPLAERARLGMLADEPELSLPEVLALEHPADSAARKALSAAIRAALQYGDLAYRQERHERQRKAARWIISYRDPPEKVVTDVSYSQWIAKDAYTAWRAQCPKHLLSEPPLSKIEKWLGATPETLPALPATLPETSLPESVADNGIALVVAENAALKALRKELKHEPTAHQWLKYWKEGKDTEGTIQEVTENFVAWVGKDMNIHRTALTTMRNRFTEARKRNPFTP